MYPTTYTQNKSMQSVYKRYTAQYIQENPAHPARRQPPACAGQAAAWLFCKSIVHISDPRNSFNRIKVQILTL